MNKTLIDNSVNIKMVDVLKDCITTPDTDTIRIATGYWDIPGTALIIKELSQFLDGDKAKLKLLIGKDPYVYANMLKMPKYKDSSYPNDFIRTDINDLADNLLDEHKQVIDLLLKYCAEDNRKIEIRIFKKNEDDESQFLHSKCYIFTCGDNEDKPMHAIVGSSNFTAKGLNGNSELNVLENDPYMINSPIKPTRKGHITWFEEKWELAEDWTNVFLEQILKKSKTVEIIEKEKEEAKNTPLTPYELYIKLLQTQFGDIVNANLTRKVSSYLPKGYDAYQFQIDAVTQCYNKMQHYGGFMLADVVGLGKTVVGTMLIKHFITTTDKDNRPRKVLIVTPPAIRKGWEDTISDFDKDHDDKIAPYINIITTGSISNLFDDEDEDSLAETEDFESAIPNEEYGLILIDESHKFRNNTTTMYKELDSLIEHTTIQPYVGLLSATPQNNRPDDIRNQIYLFSRNITASQFDGPAHNLESFFADLKRRYKSLADMDPQERKEELAQISNELRSNILDKILVRRTRTDVRGYKDADGKPVLKFPEVAAPHKLEYEFSSELTRLFNQTMNAIMFDEGTNNGLGYYRYRAIQYLNSAEHKDRYRGKGSLDSDRIANQLANIMKMLLVKRLESSFHAFRKSLRKLYEDTCIMLDMFDKKTVFICPANQIDVSAELSDTSKTWEERANTIRQKIEKLTANGQNSKGSNAEYSADDFTLEFKEMLLNDRDILKRLCDKWQDVDDPKHKVFRKELRKLLPESEPDKKLVIFTESEDTLNDISKLVKEEEYSVLCVTGGNRNKEQTKIQENFDANYKGEHKNDYQIIISTDVLAEGVNLHRAYTIINYDTPWNSTKLMQRIGRVNRIGSVADEVHVYNFMPNKDCDSVIRLFNRAYTKLQSFHSTFGEDSQVYTEDEEVNHFEVKKTDLEESESPMMKYLFELRDYKQKHPQRYEAIAKKETDLEVATNNEQKESLFVIRNNKTPGMFIATDAQGNRCRVSLEDMLCRFSCGEDAVSIDLPEGIADIKRRAIRTFSREYDNIRLQRAKNKQNDARNTIVAISAAYKDLSLNIINLLSQARDLVDNGNVDVCNCIKNMDNYLKVNTSEPLQLTNSQVEEYIQDKLQNLALRLQDEASKGEVYMSLYKI